MKTAMRTPLGIVTGLAIGLVAGLLLASPARMLQAGGGDRPDGPLLTVGQISAEKLRSTEVQVNMDAVYYLNYSRGRILAAVPLQRQTATATQVLSEFAERDLVADFRLPPGSDPHFVMTTGTLGALGGESWAPLYVIESSTGQLAIYRVEPRAVAGSSQPTFRLLELRKVPGLAHAAIAQTAAAR